MDVRVVHQKLLIKAELNNAKELKYINQPEPEPEKTWLVKLFQFSFGELK